MKILALLLSFIICFGTLFACAEYKPYDIINKDYIIIKEKSTPKDLREEFDKKMIVNNISGTLLGDNEYIGTGMTIKKTEKKHYKAVVMGDVSADGVVKVNDAKSVLRCALKMIYFSTAQMIAADMNGDSHVKAYDARAILRMALGLENLSEQELASKDIQESIRESQSVAESIRESESFRESESIANAKFDPILKADTKREISYFDNVLMIGDSVSVSMSLYASGYTGNCKFLTSGSLSATNNEWSTSNSSSVHPKINGVKVKVEDGCAQINRPLIYIMLGMNEISMGLDSSFNKYSALLERMQTNCPNAKIVVQSVTPMVYGSASTTSVLNNTRISQYNDMLKELCAEKKYYYLDLSSVLVDESGYLKREYCGDYPTMGIHLTLNADLVWIDYILTHPVPGF